MSTRFCPRPSSSAPSSPVRPASARSTIRAITSSPPPKLSKTMHLQYEGSHVASEAARNSPGRLNARPKSDGFQHTQAQGFSGEEGKKHLRRENRQEGEESDDADDADFPDTPTPMTALQKRCAYLSMGSPTPFAHSKRSAKATSSPAAVRNGQGIQPPPPQAVYNQEAALRTTSQATTNPTRRVSIYAASKVSGGTANSQRSVFSTPGRDELERKKALVEVDEGPFSRVVSMADLNETRRRLGEGIRGVEDGGEGPYKGKNRGEEMKRVCGFNCTCIVM